MNDPFEDQLRRLRPSVLPPELAARLATAPATHRPPARRILLFAAPALAAAACLAVFLWPGETAAPVLVSSHASEVTGVRPLSVFTDSENRLWEFVEVSWQEESTLVSATGPLAVQVRDNFRALVPAPVHFD